MKRFIILVLVFSGLFSGFVFGDTVYVDPNGFRDFTTIQAAIDHADIGAGEVITVMPGTYVENINMDDKAITLRSSDPLDGNVVLATVIDGNQTGSVIRCENGEGADTVIDGFLITSGYAAEGGGMNNFNSSPTVSNCTFTGNIATRGGGMFNNGSSPKVINCRFIDNSGNSAGGGMDNWNSSAPTLTGCTFIDNTAQDGCGMHNNNSSPTVIDCKFIGNAASGHGGGMQNWASSPTVTNCTFSGNTAKGDGGGISNGNRSSPIVTNCTFRGNKAGFQALADGGGISNVSTSSPTVTNCTFSGNTATECGGGLNNQSNSSSIVSNCTFIGNTANKWGGGIYNHYSSPTVSNSIIWGNIAVMGGDQTNNSSTSSTPVFSYCDIEGSFAGGIWDTVQGTDEGGNIDVNPLLGNADGRDGIYGTDDDDLQIYAGSSCIDAGSNLKAGLDLADLDGDGITNEWIPVDLAGDVRFADHPETVDTGINSAQNIAVIDMGAYEYSEVGKIEGDIDGDGDVDMSDLAKLAANWLVGVE